MNATLKQIGFFVVVAVIAGIAGALLSNHFGKSESDGSPAKLDRAIQQETDRTIGELERTVGEQRERIDSLESDNSQLKASNNRLAKHIGNARRISAELAISTKSTATDIRDAIELLEKITIQVQSLNCVLNSGNTDSGGFGGLDSLHAGVQIDTPP
jgi:predicted RNase H-like nuclease (RuvC/YqgF family)